LKELHWHPQALLDREALFTKLAQSAPAEAVHWDAEIDQKLQHAAANTSALLSGRVPGTHEVVLPPYYVAVLKLSSDDSPLIVLRLLHAFIRDPI
jgi:plasmid stabilization system protein ParE